MFLQLILMGYRDKLVNDGMLIYDKRNRGEKVCLNVLVIKKQEEKENMNSKVKN